MLIIVILIFSFIIMTLLGHLVHMAAHKPWSKIFYIAHRDHHNLQYPPSDLISDKYRSSGGNDTTIYFALIFSPLIIGNIVLTILGIIPIIFGIGFFLEMATISWLNVVIHDGVHLHQSFWHRFWFFERLQKLHNIHHQDQSKNFGIFYFVWDKLFGTYEE